MRAVSKIGLVRDAGQFYETVSATKSTTAMSELVTRVRSKSDFDSATVFLHKKRRVFLGGVPNALYGRMWCFSLEELKIFYGIAMCMSITGLGNRVVRMDGLPIGGLLSNVAASVVLSEEEREWRENETRRANLGYRGTGRRWSSLAYCKRYVDDLLVISKMWCYECLREMIPHVYTVQFDVEPQAAIVSWLDLRIVLETSEIWTKEKTFRISPPFASDFRLLRAFVIGR